MQSVLLRSAAAANHLADVLTAAANHLAVVQMTAAANHPAVVQTLAANHLVVAAELHKQMSFGSA